MSYVGVNIGALTVKVARADSKNAKVMAHQGRPLEVLEELLAMSEFADAEYFGRNASFREPARNEGFSRRELIAR